MSHSDEDRKIAAVLLGEPLGPKHVEVKGQFSPDLNKLTEPFEWEHGAIFMFCTSCGIHGELSIEQAEYYATEGGFQLSENLENHYIEMDACDSCDAKLAVIRILYIFH